MNSTGMQVITISTSLCFVHWDFSLSGVGTAVNSRYRTLLFFWLLFKQKFKLSILCNFFFSQILFLTHIHFRAKFDFKLDHKWTDTTLFRDLLEGQKWCISSMPPIFCPCGILHLIVTSTEKHWGSVHTEKSCTAWPMSNTWWVLDKVQTKEWSHSQRWIAQSVRGSHAKQQLI